MAAGAAHATWQVQDTLAPSFGWHTYNYDFLLETQYEVLTFAWRRCPGCLLALTGSYIGSSLLDDGSALLRRRCVISSGVSELPATWGGNTHFMGCSVKSTSSSSSVLQRHVSESFAWGMQSLTSSVFKGVNV